MTRPTKNIIRRGAEKLEKKYSKLDIRNLSPIIIGPLLPVRGSLEESGVQIGDQIIWIEDYGSTLSKSYTSNMKALLNTNLKSKLIIFQRFLLRMWQEAVANGQIQLSLDLRDTSPSTIFSINLVCP